MSHTSKYGDVSFIHDGDYDGDVEIVADGGCITIPFETMKELMADYIRSKRIAALETSCTDDILTGAL